MYVAYAKDGGTSFTAFTREYVINMRTARASNLRNSLSLSLFFYCFNLLFFSLHFYSLIFLLYSHAVIITATSPRYALAHILNLCTYLFIIRTRIPYTFGIRYFFFLIYIFFFVLLYIRVYVCLCGLCMRICVISMRILIIDICILLRYLRVYYT